MKKTKIEIISFLMIAMVTGLTGCTTNKTATDSKSNNKSPQIVESSTGVESEKEVDPQGKSPVSSAKDIEAPASEEEIDKNLAASKGFKPKVVSLNKNKLEQLLNKRLKFGSKATFSKYAKKFVALSALQLDYCILLATDSPKVETEKVISVYPDFYKPTLKEFLDIIARQAKSKWHPTSEKKYLTDEIKSLRLTKDVVVFKFDTADNTKSYQINKPKNWTVKDQGIAEVYKPQFCPIGMDIFDLGPFSSSNQSEDKQEFCKKVKTEVSLFWAKKATQNKTVKASDFSEDKVGKYSALYYENLIPTRTLYKAKWRQWVFMDKNRCYVILSTIFPNYETRVYPDVQSMLKSFKVKRQN